MRKFLIALLALVLIAMAAAAVAGQAQPTTTTKTVTTTVKNPDGTTQVTKTVQNPDGTYTIIEYPVGKEVGIVLDPIALRDAKGTATILRDPTGTTVKLNFASLPADLTAMNIYTVDPTGATALLGPVEITNGIGTLTATTSLDKFMLVASPETALTTYGPDTKVVFRSRVPEGYAVVPFTSHPIGEKVSAVTTTGEVPASSYTVPMLNIPAWKKGDDTKLKIDFSGEMSGARANVFLEPHRDKTDVRFRFHDLKDAPSGNIYTVWAVSPENEFFKLGQVVNVHGKNEAEVRSEVPLRDFGLLVTMEGVGEVLKPIGPRVGWVEIIRTN